MFQPHKEVKTRKLLKKVKGTWVAVLLVTSLAAVGSVSRVAANNDDQVVIVKADKDEKLANFDKKADLVKDDQVQAEIKRALNLDDQEAKDRTVDDVKKDIKRQKDADLDVYVVQPGDTLALLAKATDQEVADLAEKNQLKKDDKLVTGDILAGVVDAEQGISGLVSSINNMLDQLAAGAVVGPAAGLAPLLNAQSPLWDAFGPIAGSPVPGTPFDPSPVLDKDLALNPLVPVVPNPATGEANKKTEENQAGKQIASNDTHSNDDAHQSGQDDKNTSPAGTENQDVAKNDQAGNSAKDQSGDQGQKGPNQTDTNTGTQPQSQADTGSSAPVTTTTKPAPNPGITTPTPTPTSQPSPEPAPTPNPGATTPDTGTTTPTVKPTPDQRTTAPDSEPMPTPGTSTPNPEPTPNPVPTPEPEPTPNPVPTPEPETTPEPVPTPNPEPTPEPVPTPHPVPTPDPDPTPDPVPTPEPVPTPNPVPTPEPVPTPNPVPTPEPEPTPNPVPTPEPAPTKHGVYDLAAYKAFNERVAARVNNLVANLRRANNLPATASNNLLNQAGAANAQFLGENNRGLTHAYDGQHLLDAGYITQIAPKQNNAVLVPQGQPYALANLASFAQTLPINLDAANADKVAENVVNGWFSDVNTPNRGHRRQMLDSRWDQVGTGVYLAPEADANGFYGATVVQYYGTQNYNYQGSNAADTPPVHALASYDERLTEQKDMYTSINHGPALADIQTLEGELATGEVIADVATTTPEPASPTNSQPAATNETAAATLNNVQ
ncbi:hypothetical protein AWM75_00625 [Aerococcus urinaehominis]|uniref:Uncharacterized protein n=1 Tax=Aerococcus urinaehominis TaxID=128944 RepID=A0A0X8FJP5_9LACT|nr:CAP domain-containing protein [Aerococcus urinaehominis]AMB98585.1 hypothetical protein AWM75_00625 [Aerococcus urinaehominis]SDL76862.1 Cysteine-rich secretory protein family protein [Aerococcus urinaehominis]